MTWSPYHEVGKHNKEKRLEREFGKFAFFGGFRDILLSTSGQNIIINNTQTN